MDQSIDDLAQEVYDWASETFPRRTDASMFLKMYSELGEVIESDGDPLEVADLFILLLDYAVRKNINLRQSIITKLDINRKRKWKINRNGTMSHEEKK